MTIVNALSSRPLHLFKQQVLHQAGFTLLELLVTMGILALTIGIISFSVTGNSQRTLHYEGKKLAARLNAAHAQMMAGASPVRLVATQTGYAFEVLERAADGSVQSVWKLIEQDDVLKPRILPEGSSLVIASTITDRQVLALAREPVASAASVQLVRDAITVLVSTDGMSAWIVQ